MKVFALPAREDWVVDRFVREWNQFNSDVACLNPEDADILWLVAGWCWNHLPQQLLKSKLVVLTVHHIDPTKFGKQQQAEFEFRDQFVDWYHVPCGRSAHLVRQLTSKPIFVQPFWVNPRIWTPLKKQECCEKRGLNSNKFLIGSFQRDTEGSDLSTPKLAKGPDVFCDVVETLRQTTKHDIHVVLAGWRRQYVIKRLEAADIPYTYFERPSFKVINELYNTLDLYIVGSRHEGGPQAIFECAATLTPIISTPVGFAEGILGDAESGSIFQLDEYEKLKDNLKKINTNLNYDRVLEYFIPRGIKPFNRLFSRIMP